MKTLEKCIFAIERSSKIPKTLTMRTLFRNSPQKYDQIASQTIALVFKVCLMSFANKLNFITTQNETIRRTIFPSL